jgi:hypothetical protein
MPGNHFSGVYGNTSVTTDLTKRFHGRYGNQNGTEGASTNPEMPSGPFGGMPRKGETTIFIHQHAAF